MPKADYRRKNGTEPLAGGCAKNGTDAESRAVTRADLCAEKNGSDADAVAIFGTDMGAEAGGKQHNSGALNEIVSK